ncbi:MAG: N-6 DNA methylase [Bacteroidaceae bacterium]|nr:N-6 DNA methylase [Bacteroidaceae bacterium]
METETLKDGYIYDYISGVQVKATPEEVEAVQVYSKILVEDYNYPANCIQTRPQFRVKASPSDTQYKYPVDIVVFKTSEKKRGEEYIIVECKKKTREDGITQLKDYLKFSEAELGVWFNGESTHYIHKYIKDGHIEFEESIPNIPNYQQRLEDIGLYRRKDLKETHNLKSKFISIRNYLAGNAVGTTRDEEFARQIINIILCKLYDEKFTRQDDIVTFRAGVNESSKDVAKRIKDRFNEAKTVYRDVLDSKDVIDLDDKSLTYIVGELQSYSLMTAKRDVVGDAFEVFIHRALKGGQGQYFTPKNVVRTAINILDPDIEDKIIDPACGSGGFLIEGLKYLHGKIEKRGLEYNWPQSEIDNEKIAKANINFRGIEKDSFLSKVVKAYMVIMGDGKSGIFCEDSLEFPCNWQSKTQSNIQLGTFDILLANPPFGAKIPVKGEQKLAQFPLGHKWKLNKKTKVWEKAKVKDKEAPQVLFIDRCLDLVKEDGRLAIVLPDGMLSNPSDGYIVQHILSRAELIGLIDLPMSTFLPYTPTKTHLIFLRKKKNPRKDYTFFMSYAKTCGHDKRGREINEDEISLIPNHIKLLGKSSSGSHLGWQMKLSQIKNNILLPKYYNPDISAELDAYAQSGLYEVKSIAELEKEKIIKVSRGNEVGSENYGTGEIPFVRTSEVSNWEITSDCTHCLAEDIYEQFKDKQKIEPEDILLVNDGTYLMGRTAMITKADTKIVFQSHFRRIKVLKKEMVSPYLLLSLLGLEIVQKQIESKSFRQGTISTLGNRLMEVIVPIPKDNNIKNEIINMTKRIIIDKENAKIVAQSYKLHGKEENLMGIKNKANIGNL